MSVPDELTSVAEMLLVRAEQDPERIACVWMRDDGSEEEVSFGDLHAGACAWARAWDDAGVGSGDIVIISLDHGPDLTAAFWGAIYRGAAPAFASSCQAPVFDAELHARHLSDHATRAGAVAVAVRTTHSGAVRRAFGDAATALATPADAAMHAGAPFPGLHTHGEAIACLQFTSGSTGQPKGVMLSHRAVIRGIRDIWDAQGWSRDDVLVSWMPLYHDFGLFGGMIQAHARGTRLVAISPMQWLRNPLVQLRAVTRHRGTITFLPNFGLNVLARRARDADLAELDLDSLNVVALGGEPVIDASLDAFATRFSTCGFRPSAFVAGWGMAEVTCMLTISVPAQRPPTDWIDAKVLEERGDAVAAQRNAPGARAVVSCGRPGPSADVVVRNAAGHDLPERRLGELWARTASMMLGYLDEPEETARVLADGWYRTGDLGYLADGHVYVCGRSKDVIIVGGRNVSPVEIETLAGSIPEIAPGRVVSFGVPDEERGTEKIVLVCELRAPVSEAKRWEVERTLRHRVGRALELAVGEVRLVERGWVVKTHNGKIARSANRKKYEALAPSREAT